MIKLDKVSKFYSQEGVVTSAFSKISLDLNMGEFVVITGASGSGKSSLLNVISGLDTFQEGEVFVDGKSLSGLREEDIDDYRNKYIGQIYQSYNLINSYSVYQNIELPLLLQGYSHKDARDKVLEIIDKVGLQGYEKTKASKLSGGQKQRVGIARALIKNAPIILADEPTGNLDRENAKKIMELLYSLSKDKLVVIVTHNFEDVESLATRRIIVHDGHIIEDSRLKDYTPVEETIEEASNKEKTSKKKDITFINKLKLGVRNAFNIPMKFFLMFLVFTFLSLACTYIYASFVSAPDKAVNFSSENFGDMSNNRIIVSKYDKTPLSEEDIKYLSSLDGVKSVDIYGPAIDAGGVDVITSTESGPPFNGIVLSASAVKDQLSEGSLPTKKGQAAIFFLDGTNYNGEEFMEESKKGATKIADPFGKNGYSPIEITGYGTLKSPQLIALAKSRLGGVEGITILSDEGLKDVRRGYFASHSTMTISTQYKEFAGYSSNFGYNPLLVDSSVPRGKVWISKTFDDANYEDENPIGKEITLSTKNPNYESAKTLSIEKVISNNTLKDLELGTDYEPQIVFNPKDVYDLYNDNIYQVNVYSDNQKVTPEIAKTISDYGFKTFRPAAVTTNMSRMIKLAVRIALGVGLGFVAIALFFISYFVTAVVYKSRNKMFVILRMLGTKKKVLSQLIFGDMFTMLNIGCLATLSLIYLAKRGIISLGETINTFVLYINPLNLGVIYCITFAMTVLITLRYTKKIYKNSILSGYNEEV